MHKKAQELSIQTIIILIIVIIVLVIILLAFNGQFSAVANYFSGIVKIVTNSSAPPGINK